MFLFLIFCFSDNYRPIYRLQDNLSLFSPAVDDNGRNIRWNLVDDYFIVTYADSPTYTRLGYCSAPSNGGMISKRPITSDEFRFDVSFTMSKTSAMREGFGIWITKSGEFKNGECFGRSNKFDGLLVALVTKSSKYNVPYIAVACGNDLTYFPENEGSNIFKSRADLSNKIFNKKNTIRIQNVDNQLVISLAEKKGYTEIFKIGNPGIGKDYFLGVSSLNNSGTSDFTISGLRFYNIEKQPIIQSLGEKKERKGASIFVWIVFIVALVGIGYIVLPKQIRR